MRSTGTWTAAGASFALQFVIATSWLLGPSAPALRAQAVTGTILGTVHDSSGAAVPTLPVQIKNLATGLSRTATTNAEGMYEVPSLPTGPYSISVEAPGFKRSPSTTWSSPWTRRLASTWCLSLAT